MPSCGFLFRCLKMIPLCCMLFILLPFYPFCLPIVTSIQMPHLLTHLQPRMVPDFRALLSPVIVSCGKGEGKVLTCIIPNFTGLILNWSMVTALAKMARFILLKLIFLSHLPHIRSFPCTICNLVHYTFLFCSCAVKFTSHKTIVGFTRCRQHWGRDKAAGGLRLSLSVTN